MKKYIITIIIACALGTLGFAQTGEKTRGIFLQEGVASWYGGEFNGRQTASGEIFRDTEFTAAHPFLPFGTMLKITSQHNNKSVTVRVNDRGPFVASRIIDLSRSAALQLDMLRTGTAPVKVESLDEVSLSSPPKAGTVTPAGIAGGPVVPAKTTVYPTEPSMPPAQETVVYRTQESVTASGAARFMPAIPADFTGKIYRVQVGSYRQSQNAIDVYEKCKNAGLNPAYERYGDLCRVVLPGLKQDELISVAERLGRAGFREAVLREEL
jgi:rare lipoprotein A